MMPDLRSFWFINIQYQHSNSVNFWGGFEIKKDVKFCVIKRVVVQHESSDEGSFWRT
jgi:hypothetical protein